jgi:hypothetical protein
VAGEEYHLGMLIAARPFALILSAKISIVGSHLYLRKEWKEKLITRFKCVWSLLPNRLIELTVRLGVVQTLVKVIEALDADQKGDEQKQERDNRCRHMIQ